MSFLGKKEKANAEPVSWQEGVMLYVHDIVFMLIVVMLMLTLFFRVIDVNGPSMKNTLLNGDYLLLISNLFYQSPEQGDVVVVSKESFDHGKPIVKRIIATEGQIVDIDFENAIVYVDGLPLEEPYISSPTVVDEGMQFPLMIKEGCVFVMGDNRSNSRDSRHPSIGQVDRREILGKVALVMIPGTDYDSVARDFTRIGMVR